MSAGWAPDERGTMRGVRADLGQVVPWRNGRGTTREVVRVPDRDDWDWRLSVATSAAAAPFSSYPGVERELLLLSGTALELRVAGSPPVRLVPGQSHRFAGEAAVSGVPEGGPTTQLNLMWRRDRVAARLVLGAAPPPAVPVEGLDLAVHVRLAPSTG